MNVFGQEPTRRGPYDLRAITGTSNACYFEMLDWQADRGEPVKQRISLDDDRPDITGLYDGILATFWCNEFERWLLALEEKKRGR